MTISLFHHFCGSASLQSLPWLANFLPSVTFSSLEVYKLIQKTLNKEGDIVNWQLLFIKTQREPPLANHEHDKCRNAILKFFSSYLHELCFKLFFTFKTNFDLQCMRFQTHLITSKLTAWKKLIMTSWNHNSSDNCICFAICMLVSWMVYLHYQGDLPSAVDIPDIQLKIWIPYRATNQTNKLHLNSTTTHFYMLNCL